MTAILTTKNKNWSRSILSLSLICSLAACSTLSRNKSTRTPAAAIDLSRSAVFTYNGDSVLAEDFMYVYRKNNASVQNDTISLSEAVNDYLDLYINFKLKVKAARGEGMHLEESFQQELAQYSEQLARPYLVENRIVEQLVLESYERLKEEISAAHILIALPENAAPADTLSAYQKADSLRQLAKDGASFAMLAEQHSDDPSAAQNGGVLGYFTAMQMVYPFETAAYQTPVGEISTPVRTRFGYHIIQVNDRRPAQGSVKVAHIMIRHDSPQNMGQDSDAYKQAMKIKQELQQGGDWNELTERFSDDMSTRSSGGMLPYFETGNMPEKFEAAAFALKEEGAISEPVATRYGWHLIKLVDRKGLEPFELLRPLLERKARSIVGQEELTDEMLQLLREENDYVQDEENYRKVLAYLTNGQAPEIGAPDDQAVLFSLRDTSFTFASFKNYMQGKPADMPYDSVQARKTYQEYEAQVIFEYEKAHLGEKYEDYRRLLQEYREGILLFNIMEEKVWSQASQDTLGLKQYFETHRDAYQWKERVSATLFDAASEKVLQQAYLEADKADSQLSKKEIDRIVELYNESSALELQIHQDIYERGEARTQAESVVDEVNWERGVYDVNKGGRFYLVIIHEVLPPRPKKLEEVRGLVIADYQNELDKNWVSQLRQTYPVQVNQEVLNQIISKLNEEVAN
ncbi:MAG: peptidylprolyl isomerase [bacterium]